MFQLQWYRLPGMPAHLPSDITVAHVSWCGAGGSVVAPGGSSWVPVDLHSLQQPDLALISQLCDARPVLLSEEATGQIWVRIADRLHAERCPVILASQFDDTPPPLQVWGERGLIFDSNSLFLYPVDVLDKQGRLLCRHVQTQLSRLAGGGEDGWETWRDVQQTARLLAGCYWQAHLSMCAGEAIGELPAMVAGCEEDAAVKAGRRRVARPEPAALVVRNPVALEVRGDLVVQELMRTLLSASFYTLSPERLVAECRLAFPKGGGEMVISVRSQGDGAWEHVVAALNTLGDEVVDTFTALLALALDAHGSKRITDVLYLNVDDILAVCDRRRSHRAYLPEQRSAVLSHLGTLSRVSVTATLPSTRAGNELRLEGAVLYLLAGRIGEYNASTGEAVWERQAVRLGDWARLTPPLSSQVVVMLRQVLRYHSQKQRYEKRLGRALSLQFRSRLHEGGVVACSLRELLDRAGITPERKHPDRTRKNVRDALERLQEDGVIGGWAEGVPVDEEIRALISEQGKGWWAHYESQVWSIVPPRLVLAAYKREARHRATRGGMDSVIGGS